MSDLLLTFTFHDLLLTVVKTFENGLKFSNRQGIH